MRCIGLFVFVTLATAGCQSAGDARDSEAGVERAWRYGQHRLPRTSLREGQFYSLGEVIRKYPETWQSRVAEFTLKPGTRLPAVIYLHGCAGNTAGDQWAGKFDELGYAFFAPDSLARPRASLCGTGRTRMIGERIPMRTEEAMYALRQLRKAEWIDQMRIVLMGSSEGAQAASTYAGVEFAAVVLSATDCRFSGGSPRAPGNVPVLIMVGENDRQGGGSGCAIVRRIRGSRLEVIKGAGHKLATFPQAREALTRFLEACCAPTD